jgi:hypothetical protein
MSSRFNFNVETMFGDGEAIAEETVAEQYKYTNGAPLRTSRSTSAGGDPQALTIFSVSEIMQQIPAFASPQETLARYGDTLDAQVALALKGEGDLGDFIKADTFSPAVRQSIDALTVTEQIVDDGLYAPSQSGFATPEVTIEELEKDARIVYIDASFKDAAKKGEIHPYLLWVAKRLITGGCAPIAIVAGKIRNRQDGGTRGLHGKGWAMDIAQEQDGPSLIGSPWVTTVGMLLDSLSAPYRPGEVGTPQGYPGGANTNWFTDSQLGDRIHIGYLVPPLPPVPEPGATGGGGATAIGEVAVGDAPPRSDTKSNIDMVRVALTQLGDPYAQISQRDFDDPNPDNFDCSALVQWSAARVGVTNLPRVAAEQGKFCRDGGGKISLEEGKTTIGALLWNPGHVGLSLGDGYVVEATGRGKPLTRSNQMGTRFAEAFKIPGINYAVPAAGGGAGGSVGTTPLPNQHKVVQPNGTQQEIIKLITRIGQEYANGDATLTPYGKLQLLVAGVETAWQESSMTNTPTGDGSSVGLFQLIDAHGTVETRMNMDFSIRWFFKGAVGSTFKNGKGTAGQLAQSRQQSAHPTLYDMWRNQAVSDLGRIGIDASSVDGTPAASGSAPNTGSTQSGNIASILINGGVTVKEQDGWQNRGASGFSPFGIMLHHTVGGPGEMPTLPMLINGRPDLGGPLCQIGLGRSGTAYIIAAGIANHAGQGDRAIAQRIMDEVKNGIPHTGGDAKNTAGEKRGGPGGNQWFYGIEVENNGTTEPYPQVQIDGLVKICAALCNFHRWNEHHIIHHREWTKDKVDMSYQGNIRDMVRQKLTWNKFSSGGATPAL